MFIVSRLTQSRLQDIQSRILQALSLALKMIIKRKGHGIVMHLDNYYLIYLLWNTNQNIINVSSKILTQILELYKKENGIKFVYNLWN